MMRLRPFLLALALLGTCLAARAQDAPAAIKLPRAVAREYALSAEDLATLHDPAWSALTLAQIGAGTADIVTSMHCPSCREIGPSHLFIGSHPDLHKYLVAGVIEISAEAVAAHYLRRRQHHRWWLRALCLVPQALSAAEHGSAAGRNASYP